MSPQDRALDKQLKNGQALRKFARQPGQPISFSEDKNNLPYPAGVPIGVLI